MPGSRTAGSSLCLRLPNGHMSAEKVSNNAKAVLLGLFILVGAMVAAFAYISLERTDVPEGVSGIFSAAIVGAFTLGGTLIQNLWGS